MIDQNGGPRPSDWFYWRETAPGVYVIGESGHVYTWLIVGSARACLIDTGMGISSIRAVAESITTKPLVVVNTHFHFDHVGGNYEFDELHVHPGALASVKRAILPSTIDRYVAWARARERALESYREIDASQVGLLTDETNPRALPTNAPELLHSRPAFSGKVITIADGELIDLGNRTVRVLHTPGHSKDSVCLFDETNGVLFAGDTFNMGDGYCHFSDSNLAEMRSSIRRLAGLEGVRFIASHHFPRLIVEANVLHEYVEAMEAFSVENAEPFEDVLGNECLHVQFGRFGLTLPSPSKVSTI